VIKRFPQSVKESLLNMNRDAGTGGGSGAFPFVSLGTFSGSGLGAYSTANSSTWTNVSGSTFTFQVARATNFIYLIFATGTMTAGGGQGYVRGNISSFDTSASPYYKGGGPVNGMIWYFPLVKGPIQPGTYTATLQAATDAGSTITVNQAMHQFFDIGS
jgi:hypothetical protein